MGTKRCDTCKEEKSLEEFKEDKRTFDKRFSVCKECEGKKVIPKIIRTNKICPKCKNDLPIESFGVASRNKDGHDEYCKECRREILRNKQQKDKMKEKIIVNEKECGGCKRVLTISNFSIDKSTKDGHGFYCKSCVSEMRK